MKGCSLGVPQSIVLLGITTPHPAKTVASTCCLFAGSPCHTHWVPISSAPLSTVLLGPAPRTVTGAHTAAAQMDTLRLQALWGEVALSALVTETGSWE